MILAILQARTSSTRLPGKVLAPVAGKPMMLRQIERVGRARSFDKLLVATSSRTGDDAIAQLCQESGIACFRGALDDVLDRFYQAAAPYAPSHIVRLTADCPLADWTVIDRAVAHALSGDYAYVSNVFPPSWPHGLDVEVVTFAALAEAWREAKLPSEREHVLPFVHKQPERYRRGNISHDVDLSQMRWTVDEPEDLVFVRTVYDTLYPGDPAFTTGDVLAFLERNPDVARINSRFERNASYKKQLLEEAAASSGNGKS
jgi:spore coat polysaccharide biosynthesis protein SpsF (cytidylyltransferase family)